MVFPLLPDGGDPAGSVRHMADIVIIDGDKAIFMPFLVPPWSGDRPEKSPAAVPAQWATRRSASSATRAASRSRTAATSSQYCIPGKGTVKIDALAGNQQAKRP